LHKFKKKIAAVLIILTFIVSGTITISAEKISLNEVTNHENIEDCKTKLNTYTVYRHGIDGSIEPITIEIDESKDTDDALLDKCQELFENDFEFSKLINFSNFSFGFYSIIRSKGKGFHYQMRMLGKLTIRYILFRLGLPRIHSLILNPLIICRYSKDPKAKTTIKPLIMLNKTREIKGSHTVLVHNFVGFTTWSGRTSFSPFDIFPRSFVGLAKFAICLRI